MATNTTATSQTHNGNGSTANFAISFSFLDNTEVDVTVGGVLKTLGTHYNISGSTVTFTSGNIPPSGTANIKFQRDTNISTKKVDFQDGSVLTETDLDTNSDQVLFAQQEILDTLSGIEESATADQTNAEIRTAVEAATDSNVFTDADHSKLNAIEASATADQTSSEIKTLLQSDKLTVNEIADDAVNYAKIQNVSATDRVLGRDSSGAGDVEEISPANLRTMINVEDGATADQTNAEIRTAVEAASDSNVFTDADHSKLNAIEASADVTDATNVDAAGAVMNSDLDTKGEILVGDGSGDPTALSVGTNGHILTADSTEATGVKWAANSGGGGGSGISDVVADTTPQLGGNLDVNGNDIVSTSNGDIDLDPNGSGKVVAKGNSTRGSGQVKLNCEQNSHGVIIKGPPHSAAADYTLTLPNTDGAANQVLKTDGSGNLDWVTQTDDQTASEIVALVADQTIAPSEIDMEDDEKIKLGTSDDLEIYHNGTNSIIDNNTGVLSIQGDDVRIQNSAGAEVGFRFIADGAAELYYDNAKKAETVTGGFTVTGTCTATSFAGDGSALTGISVSVGGATGIDFNDDVAIRFGTGNDISLDFDSGTNAFNLVCSNAASILLDSDDDITIRSDDEIQFQTDGTTTQAFFSSAGLELVDNNSGQGANGTTTNVIKFHDTDTSTFTDQVIGRIDFEGSDSTTNAAGVIARIQGQSQSSAGGGEIKLSAANTSSTTLVDTLVINDDGATVTGYVYSSEGMYISGLSGANYMEEYEEGTFSPVLTGSTSGTAAIDSDYDNLRYVKIGDLVHVFGNVKLDDEAFVGDLQINMPFTARSNTSGTQDAANISPIIASKVNAADTNGVGFGLQTTANSSVFRFVRPDDNTTTDPIAGITSAHTYGTTSIFFINHWYMAS